MAVITELIFQDDNRCLDGSNLEIGIKQLFPVQDNGGRKVYEVDTFLGSLNSLIR